MDNYPAGLIRNDAINGDGTVFARHLISNGHAVCSRYRFNHRLQRRINDEPNIIDPLSSAVTWGNITYPVVEWVPIVGNLTGAIFTFSCSQFAEYPLSSYQRHLLIDQQRWPSHSALIIAITLIHFILGKEVKRHAIGANQEFTQFLITAKEGNRKSQIEGSNCHIPFNSGRRYIIPRKFVLTYCTSIHMQHGIYRSSCSNGINFDSYTNIFTSLYRRITEN